MDKYKKHIGLLLCLLMLVQYLPVAGFAAEDCPHHETHTESCGYAEARDAVPCGHEHSESCYESRCTHIHDEACGYAEARDAVPCNCQPQSELIHEASCTYDPEDPQSECICSAEAVVTHAEGCAYSPAADAQPCIHVCSADCMAQTLACIHKEHDSTCGYEPAVEAMECGFVCTECTQPELSDGNMGLFASDIDNTPPIPVSTAWSNHNLLAPGTAYVYMDVEEDLSGVAIGRLEFRCGEHKLLSADERFSYSEYGGNYYFEVPVPEGTVPGSYELYSIYLEDRAGNSCTYYQIPPTEEDAPFPEGFGGGDILVREPVQADGDTVTGTWGENITWVLNKTTGELILSGTGDMEFPEGGYAPWIDYVSDIKSVTVGEGITSIGYAAFEECRNLTSVSLPDGLTKIDSNAFLLCSSLASIQFPETLQHIGRQAMWGCDSITRIEIPAGVERIEYEPFIYSSNLEFIQVDPENQHYCNDESGVLYNKEKTELIQAPARLSGKYTIAETTESIAQRAFVVCNISSVVIPSGITTIEWATFEWCRNLSSVTFSEGLVTIGKESFRECIFSEVQFPSTLTTIEDRAFSMCPDLSNVEIPANITSIGDGVFSMSENLSFIRVDAQNPGYCNDSQGVLYSKDMTELIQAPGKMTGTYTVNASTIAIKNEAFRGCSNLRRLVLSPSVQSLGENALAYCFSLKELYFRGSAPYSAGNSMLWIETSAFYPADDETWTESALRNYGGQVRWLPYDPYSGVCGDDAYWKYDPENHSLTISGSGVTYDYDFFYEPTWEWLGYEDQIRSIDIEEGITDIGSQLCYSTEMLEELSLPDSLETIGEGAFGDCPNLKSVVLPRDLRTVGDGAFVECNSLAEVTVPNDILAIARHAFDGCESLTTLHMPDSIPSIPDEVLGQEILNISRFAMVDTIWFYGDAPEFADAAFADRVLDAYYPGFNETWTEDIRQDYGGDVNWIPYGVDEDPIEPDRPQEPPPQEPDPPQEEPDPPVEELDPLPEAQPEAEGEDDGGAVFNPPFVITPDALDMALQEAIHTEEIPMYLTATDIYAADTAFHFRKQQLRSSGTLVELSIPEEGVDTVSLPVNGLKSLVENHAALCITAENAQIILDEKAVESVVRQAAGSTVYLRWREVNSTTMTAAQRKTLRESLAGSGAIRIAKVYSVTMYSNGRSISEFDNGTMVLKLPLPTGTTGTHQNLLIYYLDSSGGLEAQETHYDDQYICVNLSHLSEYALIQNLSSQNLAPSQEPTEPEPLPAAPAAAQEAPEVLPVEVPSGNSAEAPMYLLILLLSAAAVCVVLLILILSKNKHP